MAGLKRKPRLDKGRRSSLSESQQKLIEALALEKPRRSAAAICRSICELANKPGERVPGYATVARVIRAINPALLSFQGSRMKFWKAMFLNKLRMVTSYEVGW